MAYTVGGWLQCKKFGSVLSKTINQLLTEYKLKISHKRSSKWSQNKYFEPSKSCGTTLGGNENFSLFTLGCIYVVYK